MPTIEELLQNIIRHAWKLSGSAVSAGDILRLVREQGAVILFDGLDERIVHLPPDRANLFIRTLWQVIPDATRAGGTPRRGKLLISCRSHYFRDVSNQNAMLAGEDRENMDRDQYPALCLLPFNEGQVQRYLTNFRGSADLAAEAVALIGAVHNLRELASRPYLLSLIAGQLKELEALRLRRETVNAARLYELVVDSWLNRDNGKHQLDERHKRRLMEDLAAALWREGAKSWEADRLEDWFDEFLAGHPVIEKAYANVDRKVLKEDLRTATFILRPDTEQKSFRFAHTSLQEFFLAKYLLRALVEGDLAAWDMPMASVETLDFLGQLLQLAPAGTGLAALNQLLGGDATTSGEPRTNVRASLLAGVMAFRYWLRAIEQGYPEPQPARVNLAKARLDEWAIRGRSREQPLRLRGANLAGCRLNRAVVEDVDLSGADLTGLEARQAVFQRVRAADAAATGADWCGLKWREGTLARAELSQAKLSGCQWINVDLTETKLPADWEDEATAALSSKNAGREAISQQTARLTLPQGHASYVRACAYSPDGRRVLSGSYDKTLKVWDGVSGECLLTLTGHANSVYACAYSPDGRRVLSGSWDDTLKVWNAASGECLLTLTGHKSWVLACAYSPDGRRVLSGSGDSTLKVWDTASGECLATMAAFPAGEWVALTGDETIRLASPGAWQHLAWRWLDPRTNRLRLLPAEYVGPLPSPTQAAR